MLYTEGVQLYFHFQSFHNFIPYSGALLMQLCLGEECVAVKVILYYTLSHDLHI